MTWGAFVFTMMSISLGGRKHHHRTYYYDHRRHHLLSFAHIHDTKNKILSKASALGQHPTVASSQKGGREEAETPESVHNQKSTIMTTTCPPRRRPLQLVTKEQLEVFERDGYLFVSGLFDQEEIDEICEAAENACAVLQKCPFQTFDYAQTNMIYGIPQPTTTTKVQNSNSSNNNPGSNTTTTPDNEKNSERMMITLRQTITKAFRNVAIHSKLAQISAELMQLDSETQNCRILRDVFLAKPVNKMDYCDWHVDDQGFWPESFLSTASESSGLDQNGVNVWLALDDMPAKYEGSMAVAPGSHNAEWRQKGYDAMGQDRTSDRYPSQEEMIEMFDQSKPDRKWTCGIADVDPDLRSTIEKSKVVLDMKKGDAIFATRLLYHRTLSVTEEGQTYYNSLGKEALNRYSIRYVPGTAKLPSGRAFGELSICSNDENIGKTLDDIAVANEGTPWHPKVWPSLDSSIDKQLDDMFGTKVPEAKIVAEKWRGEFFDALNAAKEKQTQGQ